MPDLSRTLDHHSQVLEEKIEARCERNGSINVEKLEARGSSAHPQKVQMHALGGVCAGEARLSASLSDHSIGHNEVF